ncbi:5206_t:CDS:2, partial [Racocetra fulgida]
MSGTYTSDDDHINRQNENNDPSSSVSKESSEELYYITRLKKKSEVRNIISTSVFGTGSIATLLGSLWSLKDLFMKDRTPNELYDGKESSTGNEEYKIEESIKEKLKKDMEKNIRELDEIYDEIKNVEGIDNKKNIFGKLKEIRNIYKDEELSKKVEKVDKLKIE